MERKIKIYKSSKTKVKKTAEKKSNKKINQFNNSVHSSHDNDHVDHARLAYEQYLNTKDEVITYTEVRALLDGMSFKDQAETEADRVADEVVSGDKNKTEIQTRASTGGIQVSEPGIKNISDGESLKDKDRSFFESRMNEDFSSVRIHNDSKAHELSEELNAKAFTKGKDIYFNRGEYDTSSTEGKRLMAHELAHVVQGGVGVSRKEKGEEDNSANLTKAEWELVLIEDILKNDNQTEYSLDKSETTWKLVRNDLIIDISKIQNESLNKYLNIIRFSLIEGPGVIGGFFGPLDNIIPGISDLKDAMAAARGYDLDEGILLSGSERKIMLIGAMAPFISGKMICGAKGALKHADEAVDAYKILKKYDNAILDFMEEAGGHLLTKHVAQANEALIKRAIKEGTDATAFLSKSAALKCTREAFLQNSNKISKWLSSESGKLVFEGNHMFDIGKGVLDSTKNVIYGLKKTRFIFIRDNTLKDGFYILTGFPIFK